MKMSLLLLLSACFHLVAYLVGMTLQTVAEVMILRRDEITLIDGLPSDGLSKERGVG